MDTNLQSFLTRIIEYMLHWKNLYTGFNWLYYRNFIEDYLDFLMVLYIYIQLDTCIVKVWKF